MQQSFTKIILRRYVKERCSFFLLPTHSFTLCICTQASSNIKGQDQTYSHGKKIYIYYVTKHHVDSLQRLLGESVEEDILDLKGLS